MKNIKLRYDYRVCPVGTYNVVNYDDFINESFYCYGYSQLIEQINSIKQKCTIILMGIPASGKSTITNEINKDNNFTVINRDKIRQDNYYKKHRESFSWKNYKINKENEQSVTDEVDAIFKLAINNEKNLIFDNTSFNYMDNIYDELDNANYNVITIFVDTPVNTCIERDSSRENLRVGYKVIKDFYNKYIHDQRKYIVTCESAKIRKAINVDIDGTLTLDHKGRSPFEWDKVDIDKPRLEIINMILLYYNKGFDILFTSGRDENCREKTANWLLKNFETYITDLNNRESNLFDFEYVPTKEYIYNHLFMRTENDCRKDSIVKHELYMKYIQPYYDVELFIDDRDQVIDLWRYELNKPTIQVNYGAF